VSPVSRLCLLILLPFLGVGCLQIETRVRLNEDGSATVTERLRFAKRLLDLGTKSGPAGEVVSLLTRKASLERARHMGKGTRLVRHEVRDAEGGARESIAVFKIPDFKDFRYASPYLATYNYPKHNVIHCTFTPLYRWKHCYREYVHPGQFEVVFTPATRERPARRPKDWKPPPPPTPADLQVLRDLRPVFRDLLKGLQFKLTFETYAPLKRYYRFRGCRSAPTRYDLIDVSDKNLDKDGFDFLANEEVMVDLLRMRVTSGNVMTHVGGAVGNKTVPLFHPQRTPPLYFGPSRQLFDKYFRGKTLDYGARWGGKRPAKFTPIAGKETKQKRNTSATRRNRT